MDNQNNKNNKNNKNRKKKSIDVIAKEVIAGRWGNPAGETPVTVW